MSGGSRRWLPATVVVLAVAAMAVAARHSGGLDAGIADGLWKHGRPETALLAVIALVVIATNFTKHRDDGYGMLHRAGTATAMLLTAAAVLTPIGLLFFGRPPQTPIPPPVYNGAPGPQKTPPGMTLKQGGPIKPHRGLGLADIIVLTVLGLILAVVLGLLTYGLIKFLSRLRFNRRPVERLDFEPWDADIEQLAEAVAAGAEALEYEGDAREAVIACYSAMEQAVGASGGGRRATDTPEEFLRRVTASKQIPEEPARRLTELFREARFSRHPIAEGQRDAAREALRAISEHLRLRAEALAEATARAQAEAQAEAQPAEAQASAPTAGRAR